MLSDIDSHENEERTLVIDITKIMDTQYMKMRQIAGIDVEPEHSDGSDFDTENVFKQLRPNAGYKLMDLLTGKVKQPKKKLWKSKRLREQAKLENFKSERPPKPVRH